MYRLGIFQVQSIHHTIAEAPKNEELMKAWSQFNCSKVAFLYMGTKPQGHIYAVPHVLGVVSIVMAELQCTKTATKKG